MSQDKAQPGIDLSDFSAPLGRMRCTVLLAIEKLDDDRREKVLAALAAHPTVIRHDMIAVRLAEWSGDRITAQTLSRHRRKKCACG